jgi:hypothetical protein
MAIITQYNQQSSRITLERFTESKNGCNNFDHSRGSRRNIHFFGSRFPI